MSNDLRQPRVSAHLGIVAILIAATPILMAIVPWDFGADFTPYRAMMRGYSFTVLIVEIVAIFLALQSGFSPISTWRNIPVVLRVSLTLLLLWSVFISVLVATKPVNAYLGLLAFAIHLIFACAMAFLWQDAPEQNRRGFMACIMIGVVCYCLLWAISCLFFLPQGPQWITHVPGVSNVRHLGFVSAVGFFASLGARGKGQGQNGKIMGDWIIIVCAVVALCLGLWTGARGSIVAIAGGVGLVWLAFPQVRREVLSFAMITIPLAIVISVLVPVPYEQYGVVRLINTVQGEAIDPSSGRVEMWRRTIEAISQRPLTGWGIDQFQTVAPAFGMGYRQPHNLLLQILFSIGLIGFSLLALTVAAFANSVRNGLRPSGLNDAAAFGIISAILILAQYDAALYVNYTLMIFALGLSLILRPIQQPATDKSD